MLIAAIMTQINTYMVMAAPAQIVVIAGHFLPSLKWGSGMDVKMENRPRWRINGPMGQGIIAPMINITGDARRRRAASNVKKRFFDFLAPSIRPILPINMLIKPRNPSMTIRNVEKQDIPEKSDIDSTVSRPNSMTSRNEPITCRTMPWLVLSFIINPSNPVMM